MLTFLNALSSNARSGSVTVPEVFTIPAQFPWQPSFSISKSGSRYITDYNPQTDKPTGTSAYISPNGSDSSGDGSSGNPYQSPERAKTAGATEIIFKDGWYDRSVLQSSPYNFTSDTALVAENMGKAYMGRSNSFSSWTQEASPNDNVYRISRSATRTVIDQTYRRNDEFYAGGEGTLIGYTKQSSIADCQANPGSFYISGSNVYVHTWDSRAPDTDVKVCLSVNNIQQADEITLYIEGLVLYGDTPARHTQTTTNTAKFIAVDTAFVHNPESDCLDINDVSDIRLVRCIAHDGVQDGFNYHTENTHSTITKSLELDCRAFRMGVSGETSRNGSSMHDYGAIIRLNCTYGDTYGPVLHDVGGSKSINLNVTASDCLIANATNSDTGFRVAEGGSIMWAKDCSTTGSMAYDRVQAGGATFDDLGGFRAVAGQDSCTIS